MKIPKDYNKEKIIEYKIPKQLSPLRLTRYRWIALFLACMLLFGDAYAFDNPQPLQTNIEEDLDISHTSFNLLYSCYSFPNMIIPIFGGFLIDFLGVRVAIFIFSTLLIIGQLIVTYGGFAKVFWLMLLGRIIFGIGSESLTVSQTSIVSMWFKNQELAFALSLNFSIPKLGSSLNSLLTPRFYNVHDNLSLPLLMGAIICIISWICGIMLGCMDRRNEQQEGKISKMSLMKKVKKLKELKLSMSKSEDNEKVQISQLELQASLLLQPHCHSATLIEENKFKNNKSIDNDNDSNESASINKNIAKSDQSEVEAALDREINALMPEIISLQDIKNLKASFWILMTICMLTEGLFIPFLDNANKFYQIRFGYDPVSAGNILIIPYVLSAFLSPLFGYIIDKVGKRGKFIILAAFLFLVTHGLFTFLPDSKNEDYFSIIPLIFLAVCFSLYSSVIMPSIPLVVESKIIGTALGLVGICQNSALAIFPLIAGAIIDSYPADNAEETWAYYYSSMFFAGVGLLVFIIAIALEIMDHKTGKILDKVYLQPRMNTKKNKKKTAKKVQFKNKEGHNENEVPFLKKNKDSKFKIKSSF